MIYACNALENSNKGNEKLVIDSGDMKCTGVSNTIRTSVKEDVVVFIATIENGI